MLQVRDLPETWFDRPQYRPRILRGGKEVWFLLDESFAPTREVPAAPPLEPREGRAILKAAFEETYERWQLPRRPETAESLSLLSREGTAVVVTGQQPGFLGGPLLTLYKALTAIAASRRYRTLTGRASIPVFWVVSEDHDLDEVREAHFPAAGGAEASFRFPAETDRRPLSEYPVDERASQVLEAAAQHLSRKRYGEEARGLIELYRGRSLAGGFAALIESLLGHTGLLILDPVALRPSASDIFRRVIERPEEILECIERGREDVRSQGLKPIVEARLPLFLIDEGKRHHLSPAPGGLQMDGGGRAIERGALLDLLRREPRSFSSGALLRPIVQQAMLPCVLSIGGPAEVGYFAQMGPLANHFAVPRPRIALRLNATLVEGKPARLAREIPLERIAAARSAEALIPPGEEPASLRSIRDLSRQAESLLLAAVNEVPQGTEISRLRGRAKELCANLEKLADRLRRIHSGQRTGESQTAEKLWSFAFPSGQLQERHWSSLHFIAKHGTAWLDELLEAEEADPLRTAHRWISFEEDPSDGGDQPAGDIEVPSPAVT